MSVKLIYQKILLLCILIIFLGPSVVSANGIDFDIIYVRYPIKDESSKGSGVFVSIPQGEKPYEISPGADLILLKPDGSEIILVDCDSCSVMDPYISYDGKTVYYSLIEEPSRESASWIYKINLNQAEYTPIRLTFNDGFANELYAGNQGKSEKHNLQFYRSIRDMAPVPLADGRLLFTSNRAALTAFNPGTDAVSRGSIQQLYVMDDHAGELDSAAKSNMHRLEAGSLHMVQHPMQLKDGRILFSSWQDAGNKYLYAMTNLMVVNPDGTNLMQFTEPHDHHKMVEHFITQLSDEQVVSGIYYPSFDYGFGILMRYPLDPEGPDFLRGSIEQLSSDNPDLNYRSFREFDRKGAVNITPHTTPRDIPAPNLSGKYSMPSASKDGGLLVAYSKGSVNYFGAVCKKNNQCEALKSGIYLIPKGTTNLISDPQQLIKVKDDPNYNEIWPRAVLPYQAIYGQTKPDDNELNSAELPEDQRLIRGEAAALVGVSSMYNREELDGGDIFQSRSSNRELHDGNWLIQGAEAGVFSNSDIYAVRIVATPAKPYTNPISKYDDSKERWKEIRPYIDDKRLDRVVARYASTHGEKWQILGEFPLSHKDKIDPQGNPDSSWLAKIPAEIPFLIQGIDKQGMTLISELTWRALKPGEKRADCGGCHAHSIEPLKFEDSAAGKQLPLINIANLKNDNPMIQNGLWDLTQNIMPLLSNTGEVELVKSNVFGVEFAQDIQPLLNRECISCHTKSGSATSLVLDGSTGTSPYLTLTRGPNAKGKGFKMPQLSKYMRSLQARQSLLTWIVYGRRLDGRTNQTRTEDIDYPDSHPNFDLTENEKRLFARWIDLGAPIDFKPTEQFGYTDDTTLPTINLLQPQLKPDGKILITAGFNDVGSGLNWDSLVINLEAISINKQNALAFIKDLVFSSQPGDFEIKVENPSQFIDDKAVFKHLVDVNQTNGKQALLLTVRINDNVGNTNVATRQFSLDELNNDK